MSDLRIARTTTEDRPEKRVLVETTNGEVTATWVFRHTPVTDKSLFDPLFLQIISGNVRVRFDRGERGYRDPPIPVVRSVMDELAPEMLDEINAGSA